jgi:DNA-directed RNA polymerase subunit M/transcription elongation factor TFIIS
MSRISKIFEDDSDDFESQDESDSSSDSDEFETFDENEDEEREEGEDETKIEEDDVNDEEDSGEEDNLEVFEEDEEYKDLGEEVKDSEESDLVTRLTKKSKRFIEFQKLQQVKDNKKLFVVKDLRDKSIDFVKKLLKDDNKSEKIEKSLFNYCVRTLKNEGVKGITLNSKPFRERYSSEIYKLMSSIKSKKDIDVIKKEYDDSLCYFDRMIYEKERIYDNKKLRLITHVNEPVSGIHKCKCGCEKVYSYELQTRSGDEGMTVFLQCSDCGKKWKL